MRDYYKLQKFNVMEIANAKNLRDEHAEGRVADKVPTSEAANASSESAAATSADAQ